MKSQLKFMRPIFVCVYKRKTRPRALNTCSEEKNLSLLKKNTGSTCSTKPSKENPDRGNQLLITEFNLLIRFLVFQNCNFELLAFLYIQSYQTVYLHNAVQRRTRFSSGWVFLDGRKRLCDSNVTKVLVSLV